MQRRARAWSTWLEIAILVACLVGATFWIISAKAVTPRQNTIRRELAQMKSQAAIAQILAEQILINSITSTYLNAHILEMQKNMQSILKSLDALGANPGLQ
jgi:hypothetical protein